MYEMFMKKCLYQIKEHQNIRASVAQTPRSSLSIHHDASRGLSGVAPLRVHGEPRPPLKFSRFRSAQPVLHHYTAIIELS